MSSIDQWLFLEDLSFRELSVVKRAGHVLEFCGVTLVKDKGVSNALVDSQNYFLQTNITRKLIIHSSFLLTSFNSLNIKYTSFIFMVCIVAFLTVTTSP